MLNYILHNLDRYPLDGVVHFELEIDYPFIHNVIDYMETECKRAGIQFVRIKPRKTWEELYDKCGFPTRKVRWCNGHYKLDAKRQLSEWLNEVGFYVVNYIGYCADEERRFNKRLSAKKLEIYPLAENGKTATVVQVEGSNILLITERYANGIRVASCWNTQKRRYGLQEHDDYIFVRKDGSVTHKLSRDVFVFPKTKRA